MNNHFVVGVFDEEAQLMAAVNETQKQGFQIQEIYSPYPVYEAIEAMGKKTRFTFAAFLFGLFGALGVLAFMYYTAVIDWPINYGGKPTNAFPSFLVVTIVITILVVTIASLFTFSARAKIYPGKAYVLPDPRSTDDKFVMVFDKSANDSEYQRLAELLKAEGAVEVYEKNIEPEN
ncbi:MAG: DUF3341 domain-containing protein [Lentimicrobiaceae bacterium]|jgi:ABC-type dipeptide/oligopeptide/nickel transport system permease component|nr:DUF3341 domain-containing protein [Lentimicrobiaceae bacterium]MDD4596990.1 DUF3341 domain-containing protein [Lentimicrobiaceae bacterium]MDY0026704.1 DUF3341 domain-containing protein [Lentimicrobium sp.]HAH58753.1 DUF3341 domain-containing protein [Bacteroidales bacterium]